MWIINKKDIISYFCTNVRSVSIFLLTQLVFSFSLYFHSYCYKTIPVVDEVDASVEDSVVVVEEKDVDTNGFIVEVKNHIL